MASTYECLACRKAVEVEAVRCSDCTSKRVINDPSKFPDDDESPRQVEGDEVVLDWYDGPLRSISLVTTKDGSRLVNLTTCLAAIRGTYPREEVTLRLGRDDLQAMADLIEGRRVDDFFAAVSDDGRIRGRLISEIDGHLATGHIDLARKALRELQRHLMLSETGDSQ